MQEEFSRGHRQNAGARAGQTVLHHRAANNKQRDERCGRDDGFDDLRRPVRQVEPRQAEPETGEEADCNGAAQERHQQGADRRVITILGHQGQRCHDRDDEGDLGDDDPCKDLVRAVGHKDGQDRKAQKHAVCGGDTHGQNDTLRAVAFQNEAQNDPEQEAAQKRSARIKRRIAPRLGPEAVAAGDGGKEQRWDTGVHNELVQDGQAFGREPALVQKQTADRDHRKDGKHQDDNVDHGLLVRVVLFGFVMWGKASGEIGQWV